MAYRMSKIVCLTTIFTLLFAAVGVLAAPTVTAADDCVIPESGPWPPCATGGNAASDGIVGPSQECIIPDTGPWPGCATGNDTGTTTGDCVIPASGPWPSCATGGSTPMPADSSTGDCVIPASGPWPPCATGGSTPAPASNNGDDCMIPASGPWPPCATGGDDTPAATDPAPQSNPYSITNIVVEGVDPYEVRISFDYSVPFQEHFLGFLIYDPDTCFGECTVGEHGQQSFGVSGGVTSIIPGYGLTPHPVSGSAETSLYVDYIKCSWGPATTTRLVIAAIYQAPFDIRYDDPPPIRYEYFQVVDFSHTWCE